MKEREVSIDTNVFTGIVEEIRNSADSLVLSERAFGSASCLEGFDAGKEIIEMLKGVHTSAKLYRQEASVSLPRALNTLRDGMIEVDKAASECLTVENRKIGGVKS